MTHTQTPMGLWRRDGSPIISQKTRPYNNQQQQKKKKKKENMQNCGLRCPGWPQNKTERMWKKDKYLDLSRELKKLLNLKMTIIPIVIGTFGTVTKGLLKGPQDMEVGRRVKTIQTTTLLRTARKPRRVLETWGDLLLLKLQWKTIS